MSIVNVIGKLVNICLLMMASLYMAVDWSYFHKCMQAYYHNYTRPTRDQLVLSREYTSQCICREWIMVLTTWYMHVSIVRNIPSQPKEPIMFKPQPQKPFQEVAADFCYHAGLIIVDCYSDWPSIIPMEETLQQANWRQDSENYSAEQLY